MDHGNGSETTHFQMVKRMDYNYIYVWIPICITHYYIYIYIYIIHILGDDENYWFYHISDGYQAKDWSCGSEPKNGFWCFNIFAATLTLRRV